MKDKLGELTNLIREWGREAGFQQIGISDANLVSEKNRLNEWVSKKYHGSMDWLDKNSEKRINPDKLHAGTVRIISARMDYLPPETQQVKVLKSSSKAYVSRYALGRDYHKLIRKRLAGIAEKIEGWIEDNRFEISPSQRAFVDSAPVLERPLAAKAGLGWIGKHTLVLNAEAGSWFFLGEIFTNIPLPLDDDKKENRCGDCEACLKVCPTNAFPRPYELDARRCISYLTIENKGPIPEEFREVMGNRVFGCDDCQLICPWNKYAKPTCEKDFHPRHGLDDCSLLELFSWDEVTFLEKTAGSPIRRIGYERWQRNLAVGLGNADSAPEIIRALEKKITGENALLKEHFEWALSQQKLPKRNRKRKLKV